MGWVGLVRYVYMDGWMDHSTRLDRLLDLQVHTTIVL